MNEQIDIDILREILEALNEDMPDGLSNRQVDVINQTLYDANAFMRIHLDADGVTLAPY